jgi:hypothetical protein
LIDDHKLRRAPGTGQLRGTTGEQRPVLNRGVRKANDERGEVRGPLFDPVARK